MSTAIQKSVDDLPKDAVVGLRLTRNDMIEQVLVGARERTQKAARKLRLELDDAVSDYVRLVNTEAMKKARPVIAAFEKHAIVSGEFSADFKLRIDTNGSVSSPHRDIVLSADDHDDGSDDVKAPESHKVQISQGSGWDRSGKFKVLVPLTATMRKQWAKLQSISEHLGELRVNETKAEQRVRIRDLLVQESLEQTPEGKQMLRAMERLLKQAERRTGKPALAG